MSNTQSTLKTQFKIWPSSLYTLKLDSTYDPTYCKSGPSDRNPEGKGEAIKYNSYTRRLNRLRKKNCDDKKDYDLKYFINVCNDFH